MPARWAWEPWCVACASSPPIRTRIPRPGSRPNCWHGWPPRGAASTTHRPPARSAHRASQARARRARKESPVVDAVIVSTARTALAKSWRGAFNLTHGATLGGHVVKAAIERAGIEPATVEDVIMGCANPEGATGFNIARQIALRAGCPVSTAGMTVNRFCSSGLQTIALAAQRIMTGEGEVYVAGGVESISCVQNEHMNTFMAKEPWLDAKIPGIYWT